MVTILFAGHNLNFIEELMKRFSKDGHTVIRDQWGGHSNHDEETSPSLLSQADIIVCEWALGNSVWYSNNVVYENTGCVDLIRIDFPYRDDVSFNLNDSCLSGHCHDWIEVALREAELEIPEGICFVSTYKCIIGV